jgi:exosortase K
VSALRAGRVCRVAERRAHGAHAARFAREHAAHFAAALLAGFALKTYYARASAEALGFVLAPTAVLVEQLSGVRFELEPGAGYLSRERRYLIAPACAGLNFTIAAFATLVIGFAPRIRRSGRRWAWLLAAATLLVNAARIALALELREAPLPAVLSAENAHRALGVALYLGSLWTLWAGAERAFAEPSPAWRAALLPLAVYLGITLVAPLLNGGYERSEFWAHARFVLALSCALAALAYALLTAVATRRAAARRATRRPAARP